METIVLRIDNKRKLKLFKDLAQSLNVPFRLASSVDEIRQLISELPDAELSVDEIQEEINQARKLKYENR
jgi:hypothetical protein